MTNEELIAALRYCSDNEKEDGCDECPYLHNGMCHTMLSDAAYALEAAEQRIAELEKRTKLPDRQEFLAKGSFIEEPLSRPKEGEWIMDENPHDGDCRCSVCLVAIDAMHERNHKLLNALTGGKWWTFYHYCPKCGAKMKGANDEQIH